MYVVKEQKITLFAINVLGILMLGVLAISLTSIQQATALVGSASGPNPQGQGSGLQGNPIGSSQQGSGPSQGGGGNPIDSTESNPIGSSPQAEQQGSEIQKQPPGAGGGCLAGWPNSIIGIDASLGRCIRG